MFVRVRYELDEKIVFVASKLTLIEKFRLILKDKYGVPPKLQRLFYGGKLLEDGYTFHDYNIKLNDVIQFVKRAEDLVVGLKKQQITHHNVDSEMKNDNPQVEIEYNDADSELYAVGDLIDMRHQEHGGWVEGEIVRIVHDPNPPPTSDPPGALAAGSDAKTDEANQTFDKNDDLHKKLLEAPYGGKSTPNKGTIEKYFMTSAITKGKQNLSGSELANIDKYWNADVNLLYKVHLQHQNEDSILYCKKTEIRPRARTVLEETDLKVGQEVMINHNIDNPAEKGYWYDFEISKIIKVMKSFGLIGTLYMGPEAVPQNDTKIKVHDKIFAKEKVVPLALRTKEYRKLMITPTERRSRPLYCMTCRDIEGVDCKDCGCCICSGNDCPEKILLCDECNMGFHMNCLSPPLTELPDGDWYCPTCKTDPNDVVAPGAAKQAKKSQAKTTRDWGRGMACAGKTKTSAMPANHFGPIPGIEVGMCWRFRIQLSESGVHRPPVSGIHGRDVEGAYSIVLSGGYEDDVDYGNEFTYTGSGGRDLSGNKRTAGQSCDQTLTRENRALARNCAVNHISEEGGDAGDNWRKGKPVRVVRSYKMLKHFPKYAPKEGIRYDGIYKVVKYYPEIGLSGFRVWKYLLRRDDPGPAPWEAAAKDYSIVYPDGYLEAEAEKKAQKEALKQKNKAGKSPRGAKSPIGDKSTIRAKSPSGEKSPRRASSPRGAKSGKKSATLDSDSDSTAPPISANSLGDPRVSLKRRRTSSSSSFSDKKSKIDERTEQNEGVDVLVPPPLKLELSEEERAAIDADTLNAKLWSYCLKVCDRLDKKVFLEHVIEEFSCAICHEVATNPVTTPCSHNFCMKCLKLSWKIGSASCPACRTNLSRFSPEPNKQLTNALRVILQGYDSGKKLPFNL